ncbi:unnamed protein product [Phytophthora lilii]|uniref:Unnamed protein product n=1 Tax=Phytophthora lilii TaxID=2077276 RepID=A0A9W6WUY7_9STRA|nr:unnamed protein product [Phytophthora lilii]
MRLLSARKKSSRTWNDHFLYLNALMSATLTSSTLVLENGVKYANPDLKLAVMAKYDPTWPDVLQQASELGSSSFRARPLKVSGSRLNAVTQGRNFYKCHEVGHIRRDCPQQKQKKDGDKESKSKWALVAHAGTSVSQSWILLIAAPVGT